MVRSLGTCPASQRKHESCQKQPWPISALEDDYYWGLCCTVKECQGPLPWMEVGRRGGRVKGRRETWPIISYSQPVLPCHGRRGSEDWKPRTDPHREQEHEGQEGGDAEPHSVEAASGVGYDHDDTANSRYLCLCARVDYGRERGGGIVANGT